MTKPLPKKILKERKAERIRHQMEFLAKKCDKPIHRLVKIVPVKIQFPETGNDFWDAARFEHFLDALSAEGYWEGRDWKYYWKGKNHQFLVLNQMIFRNRKVEKIWTRYGLIPEDKYSTKIIKG